MPLPAHFYTAINRPADLPTPLLREYVTAFTDAAMLAAENDDDSVFTVYSEHADRAAAALAAVSA